MMKQPLFFGGYELHLQPLQLREGRRVVDLTPRQLSVLCHIVQARGKIVAKESLLKKVWNDVAVEDGNLTQAIFIIRRRLGKLPGGMHYIETVPKKGYRLSLRAVHTPLERGHLTPPRTGSAATASELAYRDEQFRLLVESIEDYAIYMLDCAGRILTWNPGAENSQGYSHREVIGQHYSLFFVPEDVKKRTPDRELSVACQKGRCVGEGWRLRKNGDRFWASFVLTAVRDSAGKLVGYAKVVRDLSEPKRREDALLRLEAILRKERDRLHEAAESSIDGFYICEAVRNSEGEIEDFVYTYINRKVEEMLAIPRASLLGARMCALVPSNLTSGLFEQYKLVVATGKPYVTEVPVNSKKAINEWIRVQAVRLYDGIAITASDITKWKQEEERIALVANPVSRRNSPVEAH